MINEQFLLEEINQHGLVDTIAKYFGTKVSMEIGFQSKDLDRTIEEIGFSVRSQNAMMRAGYRTLKDVVEAIRDDKFSQLKNLGKKSINEIKTKVIAFA